MNQKKIAIFCSDSRYSGKNSELADFVTKFAEIKTKTSFVHYFTPGNSDYTVNRVQYHTVPSTGTESIDEMEQMSYKMVDRFYRYDTPRFHTLYFFNWPVTDALQLLHVRDTVFTYFSTEWHRHKIGEAASPDYEILWKEWYAGHIAGTVVAANTDAYEDLISKFRFPEWMIQVHSLNPNQELELFPDLPAYTRVNTFPVPPRNEAGMISSGRSEEPVLKYPAPSFSDNQRSPSRISHPMQHGRRIQNPVGDAGNGT